MMECNDCLFDGWDVQKTTTHLERLPDKSEVETHIFWAGHINDKPEGDKMLGDLGTVTRAIAFVQPVTGWVQNEAGQLIKA